MTDHEQWSESRIREQWLEMQRARATCEGDE